MALDEDNVILGILILSSVLKDFNLAMCMVAWRQKGVSISIVEDVDTRNDILLVSHILCCSFVRCEMLYTTHL